MKRIFYVLIVVLVLGVLFTGCQQSLVISQVDYAQPVESVLEPDSTGKVEDIRSGLSFNILSLQHAETGDSSSVHTEQIRLLRGKEGYYYITAENYRHVYVMAPEKSSLKLVRKVKIDEDGIKKPALNQREGYVLLLSRETDRTYQITPEGIRQESEEN
ncbi:MAG: hypothetical protein R3222_10920 [Balneolaceae bacterium]|nr:hypothetical protein [Balneolaceae bacterium]